MITAHDDIPAEELGGGITRRILSYSETLMICELVFEKGAVGAMHSHPHEQIGYVVSGSFEVTEAGIGTRIVAAGSTYHISPDIRHGVTALERSVLVDVFTPMRKDFIK